MKQVVIRISRKKFRAVKMLTAGCLLIGALMLLDSMIRPMITQTFIYQANICATDTINRAVLKIISQENVEYSSIVLLQEDEEGRPAFLETDMVALNRLKAELTSEITANLNEDANKPVQIQLGTILGGQYLAGRGPTLEFEVIPMGYVQVDFHNEFLSAGINQTLHQLMMDVKAPVSAVLPFYSVTETVHTEICIAETVIVGQVPQAFTDINGDHSDDIQLHNDYKAELPAD